MVRTIGVKATETNNQACNRPRGGAYEPSKLVLKNMTTALDADDRNL